MRTFDHAVTEEMKLDIVLGLYRAIKAGELGPVWVLGGKLWIGDKPKKGGYVDWSCRCRLSWRQAARMVGLSWEELRRTAG
jgi:hypothetical protein